MDTRCDKCNDIRECLDLSYGDICKDCVTNINKDYIYTSVMVITRNGCVTVVSEDEKDIKNAQELVKEMFKDTE